MEKKKRTFSILRVVKTVVLFFVAVILIVPLIIGIDEKRIFPAQHEKEIKKLEEKVKKSCNSQCVSEIKEQPKLWGPMREWKEKELKELKKSKSEGFYVSDFSIESVERELNAKIKYYCKDEICDPFTDPCEIVMRECVINKATLSEIKERNFLSIFHYYGYYGKIIEYTIEFIFKHSIIFMFIILLTLTSITLFEVAKLKNKNDSNQ